MLHSKRLFPLILAIALLLSGCSEKENTATVEEDTSDIISILFHEPYLRASNIEVHHQSDRRDIITKINDALNSEPVFVEEEGGGLFEDEYYALTVDWGDYYYYGKTKNNRPDGFGVLTAGEVTLDDISTLNRLIYAGEFEEGRYNGYGALFCSNAEHLETQIYGLVDAGLLEQEFVETATAYVAAYVICDGDWKDGKAHGENNYFDIDCDWLDYHPVQDGYWGGGCYPSQIAVTETKSGEANGNSKLYEVGVLKYEGETKRGYKHGDGVLYHSNGQVEYDGEWKNGSRDGKGKLYDEGGKLIYDGTWKKGDYAS